MAQVDSARWVGGWQDYASGEWKQYTDATGEIVGDAPTDEELADSPLIRVAATDSEGEIQWLTTDHLTDDYTIDDVIDEFSAEYGGEFV